MQWAFSRMGQNQCNRFPIFPKMKHGTRKRTNINWSRILRAQYNARNRSNKYKNALDHRQDTETYDMYMRGAIAASSLCTTTSIMTRKIQILKNHSLSCGDKPQNNGTNACHAGLKAAIANCCTGDHYLLGDLQITVAANAALMREIRTSSHF